MWPVRNLGPLKFGANPFFSLVQFMNILFFMVGIALIVTGSIYSSKYKVWSYFTANYAEVIPIVIVFSGLLRIFVQFFVTDRYSKTRRFVRLTISKILFLLIVIAFLGCCGSVKESPCMLLTHCSLLVILFSLQLVTGITGYAKRNDLKIRINHFMQLAILNYNKLNEKTTTHVDYLQYHLNCCGVNSLYDWIDPEFLINSQWVYFVNNVTYYHNQILYKQNLINNNMFTDYFNNPSRSLTTNSNDFDKFYQKLISQYQYFVPDSCSKRYQPDLKNFYEIENALPLKNHTDDFDANYDIVLDNNSSSTHFDILKFQFLESDSLLGFFENINENENLLQTGMNQTAQFLKSIHSQGCLKILETKLVTNFETLALLAIIVSSVEFFGVILSCILWAHTKKRPYNVVNQLQANQKKAMKQRKK